MQDYCDRCLTRVAVLSLRLRALSAQLHKQAGHDGIWTECTLEPCATSARVLLHDYVDDHTSGRSRA